LRGFAEKTLPTLKHHYEMVQEIATSQNRAEVTQQATDQGQTVQKANEQNQAQTTTQPDQYRGKDRPG
jgi:hypothetical protein